MTDVCSSVVYFDDPHFWEKLPAWYFTPIEHFKSATTNEFLVEPADQNCVLARWCFAQGVIPECFWQMQQALEKYLEAVILTNAGSIRRLGHDLSEGWNLAEQLLDDYMPRAFVKPSGIHKDRWQEESIQSFLAEVMAMGGPHARYGLSSWWLRKDWLFKSDQLAFQLRRLSLGADWRLDRGLPSKEIGPDFSGLECREVWSRFPRVMLREVPRWHRNSIASMGSTVGDALLSWNLEYANFIKEHPPIPTHLLSGFGFGNSHLNMCWQALQSDRELPLHFLEGIKWILDEIPMPKEDKQAIEEDLAKRTRG